MKFETGQTLATCRANNVASCWPTMLRAFARAFRASYVGDNTFLS